MGPTRFHCATALPHGSRPYLVINAVIAYIVVICACRTQYILVGQLSPVVFSNQIDHGFDAIQVKLGETTEADPLVTPGTLE
jgi:hypothetical protein